MWRRSWWQRPLYFVNRSTGSLLNFCNLWLCNHCFWCPIFDRELDSSIGRYFVGALTHFMPWAVAMVCWRGVALLWSTSGPGSKRPILLRGYRSCSNGSRGTRCKCLSFCDLIRPLLCEMGFRGCDVNICNIDIDRCFGGEWSHRWQFICDQSSLADLWVEGHLIKTIATKVVSSLYENDNTLCVI